MSRNIVADLHMHTAVSDGSSTLKERVSQAEEKNLDTIAITDHDTIHPRFTGRTQTIRDVNIVSGVEIKTEVNKNNIEILGYFINPENSRLNHLLDEVRSNRRKRNEKIAKNINKKTSATIDIEELREESAGFVARPHFADELIEQKIVDNTSEAFKKHLSSKSDCYSPMERVSAERVINAIHEANGICSLAHPGRAKTEDIEKTVSELKNLGLDALEVYYPYKENPPGRYAGTTVEEAERIAENLKLLKTGGSDCHGKGSDKFRIGNQGLKRKQFEKLKERAGL